MKSEIKVNCPLSVRRKCKCLWECHHQQCATASAVAAVAIGNANAKVTLAAPALHCVLTELHGRQQCVCACVCMSNL